MRDGSNSLPTRAGLICLERRLVLALCPVAHAPDRIRPDAAGRDSSTGRLDADVRNDLGSNRSRRREISTGERTVGAIARGCGRQPGRALCGTSRTWLAVARHAI
jgi:hypothetical protein